MIKKMTVLMLLICLSLSAGKINVPKAIEGKKVFWGTAIEKEDLYGKVILLEFWGTKCPPCIASLPDLQKLHKKYVKKGKFMVVGSHVQSKTKDTSKILKSRKISFPIYQFLSPKGTPSYQGIPFQVLVNYDGTILEKGHVSDKAIKRAVKKAPGAVYALYDGVELKKLKSEAKKLSFTKNITGVLKTLKVKSQSSAAVGEEAKALHASVTNWIEEQISSSKAQLDEAPTKAYVKLKRLQKMLAKSEYEKDFLPQLNKLQKDKNLAAAVALQKSAKKVFRKNKKAALKKILASAKSLKKKKLSEGLSSEIDALIETVEDKLKG